MCNMRGCQNACKQCDSSVNKHSNRWLGYKEKHLMERDFPSIVTPAYRSRCICARHITEQYYIVYKDYSGLEEEIIVVGNCCIEKYLPREEACCVIS